MRILFLSAFFEPQPMMKGLQFGRAIEPNFVPNLVVDISEYEGRKAQALACYKSQVPPFPSPRSVEAALALARFRGKQAGFASGEAFHVVRMKV